MDDVVEETNQLKRAWIWLWYSTWFRVVFVILGGDLLILVPLMFWLGVPVAYFRPIASGCYLAMFGWAMADNDFSNLRRIGLDEYRQALKSSRSALS